MWLRPDNLDHDRSPDAGAVVAAQCAAFVARPEDEPAALARRLWDLGGWAAQADALRGRMAEDVARLEAGDTDVLAPAFVVSAAVLRHLLADPQLPLRAVPTGVAGRGAAPEYERYDVAFKAVWRDWFRRQR